MATATRKSSKATVVTHNLVGQAETFLQDLPEKPKQDLSLREAIGRLQEPLQAALAKGYNYEELAQLLSVHGIRISPLTLKNYVPSGRRRAATAKSRRPKTADDAVTPKATPADSETTAPAIAPESTPATIKPRRGRTKAALNATEATETTPAPTETTPDSPPKKRSTRTRQTTQPANRPTVARRRKSAGL